MEGKLTFHVRKFLDQFADPKSREEYGTIDDTIYFLLEKYPEYRRKSSSLLRHDVEKCTSTYDSSNTTLKRRRSLNEKQEILSEKSKNSLNNSLAKNYKVAESKAKKEKKTPVDTTTFVTEKPTARYDDIGGIEAILSEVKELVEFPFCHPEVYSHLGVDPPRGILLHGPPGTGKSMLAHAIAAECDATFLKVSAPEIVSGMSGESEEKLRKLFDEAITNAPSLIFIDEIDAITPKRENSQRGMEKRIVAQLLTCTDELHHASKKGKHVMIIGATNMPDSLDPALRRAGRFDREILMGIPDDTTREGILKVMCKNMAISSDFDFKSIARQCPGYVGADLSSLVKQAASVAVKRAFSSLACSQKQPFSQEELESLNITMHDFMIALPKVQPSAKREGFATIPNVSWSDIGALEDIREELTLSILHPILYPERFEQLGLSMPAGVLLYGPPGCGKTLLAKAIANESRANFISVKGPELLDKYVGESERAVRQVFQRAQASAPCIIFFDELDALCPRRSNASGGSGVTERVVNQLLTEMDGLDARRNIFVIAATNRPDIIDPAMLRPGRLDKLLYVPLPTASEREIILTSLASKLSLNNDIDMSAIAHDSRCNGFSGADLNALVREAGLCVLREAGAILKNPEAMESVLTIGSSHFEQALTSVFPSVSKSDELAFNKLRGTLRKSRSALNSNKENPSCN